jgi:hypothetical protein
MVTEKYWYCIFITNKKYFTVTIFNNTVLLRTQTVENAKKTFIKINNATVGVSF